MRRLTLLMCLPLALSSCERGSKVVDKAPVVRPFGGDLPARGQLVRSASGDVVDLVRGQKVEPCLGAFETSTPGISLGGCGCVLLPSNGGICPPGDVGDVCDVTGKRDGDVCGVSVEIAERAGKPVELSRADGGKPDLSCLDAAAVRGAGAQASFTLRGFVRPLRAGCDTAGVKVEVFRAPDPTDTQRDTGAIVGVPYVVGTAAGCTGDAIACRREPAVGLCEGDVRTLRAFEVREVPTETELLVRVSAADAGGAFVPVYEEGLRFSEGELSGGAASRDVWSATLDDLEAMHVSSVLSRSATPGLGVLWGTVRDCAGAPLSGASVDISGDRATIAYPAARPGLSSLDERRPADGTDVTGTFVALDAEPGPLRVAALGVTDGAVVAAGFRDVRVHANGITIVTLQSLTAWQASKAVRPR